MIYMCQNEKSLGFTEKVELRIPFEKVLSVLFEPSLGMLLLQSKKEEKSFFMFDENQWSPRKIHIGHKYHVLRIIEGFIISLFQDGHTFLIELNGDELGFHL